MLRPGEDEPTQRPLPRPRQEPSAEGLPRHVRGHVRLSVMLHRRIREEESVRLRHLGIK